jgi:Secretion system C-terminal sorting domain
MKSNSTGKFNVGAGSCGGSGCHGTSSGNANNDLTGLPGYPDKKYTPGHTYTLTLTVAHSTNNAGGFNVLVDKGTIVIGNNTGIQLNGTKELTHTQKAIAVGGICTWTFEWKAPASGSGMVNFRVVGNAVNNNGLADASDKWATFGMYVFEDVTPTSITNVNDDNSISFNNPCTSQLEVNSKLKTSYKIFDINGKQIMLENYQVVNKTIFNTSNLMPGLYLQHTSSNGVSEMHRFVKEIN